MENSIGKKIRVRGRVQRVGFRLFVRDIAEAFDINGTVRNSADGSVEIEASGSEENLRSFIEQIEIGPTGSRVEEVDVVTLSGVPVISGFRIIP
ncbi:MAG: acylphosphatase [Ignavibacteriae bacterium]|nr:acylphosphatase [Ignavibacteriota bacterium]MCB9215921.1 acylphosphatase [Ignavibacteria bacterium]